MKKHILATLGKKVDLLTNNTFYDFKKQISYIDKKMNKPVVQLSIENTTYETSSIETSDMDEFATSNLNTTLTETIETSDSDGFCMDFSGTKETRTIEDSDVDAITSFAYAIKKKFVSKNKLTPTIGTVTTYTIETSDPDEFALD